MIARVSGASARRCSGARPCLPHVPATTRALVGVQRAFGGRVARPWLLAPAAFTVMLWAGGNLCSTALHSSMSPCLLQTAAPRSKRLAGRRVLVTGGGRGIGRAIALLCAEEGADVAILARSPAQLQTVKEEATSRYGGKFMSVTADVTSEEEVEAAIAAVVAQLGGIDLLVNNVGGNTTKNPLHRQSPKDFHNLMNLNVASVLIVSSAVLHQAMLKAGQGDIVNVSSRAGRVGLVGNGLYCASKFALEGITATMAEELRESGIRVNSISPGMVDTVTFPKKAGQKGVRTAESVKDGFLAIVESGHTGKYLHVDEYDSAVAAGTPSLALKPINEPTFEC